VKRGARSSAPLASVERDQQNVATIVPVPGCPGLGAYPGSTFTTTMCFESPEIVEPDFDTELVTTTPI
jgi:hypothetical protein